MERDKWVVYFNIIKEYHAGNKYESDVLKIFSKCGFRIMEYGKQKSNKIKIIFLLMKFLWDIICFIRKKSIVFFLAPIKHPYDKVFRIMTKIKKLEIYAFVIDINGLRGTGQIKRELANFMLAKGIIVQNDVQKEFLRDKGYKGHIYVMGILDFLSESDVSVKNGPKVILNAICYGGNLARVQSGFLYKWTHCTFTSNLKVWVYGINLEEEIDNNNFQYRGNFPPNQVAKEIEGDFGLVWNGTEISACGGSRGEYYKYASPHKLSMYIVAGMPVIVWENSAMKNFVEDNGIGFSVASLDEIEEKVALMNMFEYKQMLTNVYKVRQKLITGYYAETCIIKCCNRND